MAAQRRTAGQGRAAQHADRQRPAAPVLQMADGDAVGFADQEFVGLRLRACVYWQVERQADLSHCAGAVPAAARSEEHTSELQSLMRISYAVFCLKKQKKQETKSKKTNKQTK